MALEKTPSYRFGPFRLDPSARRLTRDGEPVQLTARAFDTLVVLVENRGRAVGKDELIGSVWRDTFVEENNLNQAVSALRKALRDGSNGEQFIQTIPRRGYDFVAQVVEIFPPPSSSTGSVEQSDSPLRAPREAPAPDMASLPAARPGEPSQPAERLALRGHRMASASLAILFAMGLTIFLVGRRTPPPRAITGVRSVAILPFEALSAAPSDGFLGVALADAVIVRLGRLDRLSVLPTAAIRDFDRPGRDALAAGQVLRVDAVLDGRIQESAGRVRVTVQLLRTDHGSPIWAQQFDVSRSNLFEMEDAIAGGVARELDAGLARADARRLRAHAPAPEAYETYLRGRYLWNKRTGDELARSRQHFQKSIDLDPDFAAAWAGLADADNLLGEAPEAKAAAERAVALDPGLAEAHAALGNVALFYDFDFPEAERRFQRAITLNPSYATAHQWYAYRLAATGRFEEALVEIRRAHELDPLSLSIATDVGDILRYAGRYAEAEREARRVATRDPEFAQARNVLAAIALARNDPDAALRELPAASGLRVAALAQAGRADEAREVLRGLDDFAGPPGRGSVERARILAALGSNAEALEALEDAYRLHCGELAMVAVDPQLAVLRSQPRFAELLRRLGLPAPPAGG